MPFTSTASVDLLIPHAVAKLAKSLHAEGNSNLTIECSDIIKIPSSSDLWTYTETHIIFATLEVRNNCVAELIFSEFTESSTPLTGKMLFDAAYELWRYEISHADKASGKLLAMANTRVSIFQLAIEVIQTGDLSVFDTLHLLEAAMPYLSEITVDDLLGIVEAQYKGTKGDLAAGLFFNAIEKALISRPELAKALYERVKSSLSDSSANLYSVPLMALALAEHLDETIKNVLDDMELNNPLVVRLAIITVGMLLAAHELKSDQYSDCIEALRKSFSSCDINIHQAAIQAIGHAASKHRELLSDLLSAAQSSDQFGLVVISNFLLRNFDAVKSDALFPELVRSLKGLLPTTARGIDNFDWVLSNLIGDPYFNQLSYECLTEWIVLHGDPKLREKESVEVFDQTIQKLVEMPEILSNLITHWFVADEQQLGAACSQLISFLWVRGFRQPIFSKSVLDNLNATDCIYLVRRMLGYVYSEDALLSLTFSLLNTENASERTHGLVHALLCQELGRDYHQATLDAIDSYNITANSELNALLESARTKLLNYSNALYGLPRLQELKPPLQVRRALALQRSKGMRKSMDDANEKSIIRQIATQIPLKAGLGWFSVYNGNLSETNHLHSLSHEVSLPRRLISDPVGYAISGLGYRIARRGDE